MNAERSAATGAEVTGLGQSSSPPDAYAHHAHHGLDAGSITAAVLDLVGR